MMFNLGLGLGLCGGAQVNVSGTSPALPQDFEMPFLYEDHPDWTNPEESIEDNSDAAELSGWIGTSPVRDSSGLAHYNYGVSVPTGATIVGVELQVNADVQEESHDLIVGLANIAGEVQFGIDKVRAFGEDSRITQIYGGRNDLWGSASLTPSIVNSSDFGVFFYARGDASTAAMMELYWSKLKVYYVE